MSSSSFAAPSCLLCGSINPQIRQTLTMKELAIIWRLAGIHLTDSNLENLARAGEVHLYQCQRCEFEFFDPRLAGPDRFYGELHAHIPGYYAPDRPENERNARFAQEHKFRNILDIGCGTGLALDVARQRGLETFGVEFNHAAAEEARSRGHTVFEIPIQEIDSKWNGYFDLISLNQILEHVPDPVALIKSCIPLLTSHGVIAIAVPSSEGIVRYDPWMPLNWPPHHISRWRRTDLSSLSTRCGLVIVASGGDQLLGRDMEKILLANREHCLVLGKPYRGPSTAVIRLLGFIYRKTGMKYFFRSQGHSIFCFLKRK